MRRSRPRRSVGFTLVEVIVALAIAGIVVLVAERLFAGAADAGEALRAARQALDREANARRWLAATFLSLDVGTDPATGFDGTPDRVVFSAWELVPEGWFERRRVILSRVGKRLIAELTPGDRLVLADSVVTLNVDYLLEPGAESRWVRTWQSPVSAPLAVRLRVGRMGRPGRSAMTDTVLFLIKERG